jgi:hypothetical protein
MKEVHHLGASPLNVGEWHDAKVDMEIEAGRTVEFLFKNGAKVVFRILEEGPAELISGVVPKRLKPTHWRYLVT